MNELQFQAKEVISALRCYVERIVQIENLIGNKEDFTREDKAATGTVYLIDTTSISAKLNKWHESHE
jgi:hypothetical protein